jgi:micrococcal nuclease
MPPPNAPAAPPTPADPTSTTTQDRAADGTVVDVVDGDTVDVALVAGGMVTVRVLGIDTPEVYFGVDCWGPEASEFAERTLAGRQVTLRRDPTQDDVDGYGRALRYIVLADGRNYSVLAAEAGAARSYLYDSPVQLHPQISAAEQRAQRTGVGLWGRCHGAEVTAEPAPAPAARGNCYPGYDPCVPPAPPDLDCADVDARIEVTGDDPHRLDGDGDGMGCDA